ncbi:MAG: terminase TerL endonuclease subunit [Alphaproteobacteria bacterium]
MSFQLDKRKACPVTKYARQVVEGKIVAGKWVKLACQRHLDDLKNGPKRGLYFDRAASEKAIYFCELLRHTKGEWGGQRIKLSLWQKFVIGSVFGWKWAATGLRRFRKVYKEVARKNGKSTECGAIGLFLFTADGEPGAEIYTAATKRDQARIVFDETKNMVLALPSHYELRQIISVWQHTLVVAKTASKMMPLSADDKTMDGLNPHGAIIDELHAHKTRGVLDILDTAMGARRQPLRFAITTAGHDRHSVCWEEREYSCKVLEKVIEDDSVFAYIATIDEGDDPFDEKVWIKANPNLGISVKLDYLRDQAKKAKEVGTFFNEFLRLHLNVWTEAESRWMGLDKWDACKSPVIISELIEPPCWGGLDLSSTTDLSAFLKVWAPTPEDKMWRIHARFWLPRDTLQERVRKDRVPYDVWAREGYIDVTDGNVIDHNFIQARIEEDWENFNVQDIGFDPWNSTMLTTRLMNSGVNMVAFRQGFISMSPAVKQLEKIILSGELAHGGNPVLRWMMSNVVMRLDPAGNVKPDKEKSSERIDGIVALIMAVGRASVGEETKPGHTATHGVVFV